MRDLSYIVALFGMLFLAVAGLAWFRIIRKPDEQPPTKQDDRRSGSAAMVLTVAFLLSAVAAFLALFAMFFR